MRADTKDAIERLPGNGTREANKRAAAFEELESRLSPERRVTGAFITVASPNEVGTNAMDLGVMIVSSYGLHFLGERSGRMDVSWDQAVRCDVTTVSLSMIRKKYGYYLQVETHDHDLRFSLTDEAKAGYVKAALAAAQPML
jgi:hypothetical protein